ETGLMAHFGAATSGSRPSAVAEPAPTRARHQLVAKASGTARPGRACTHPGDPHRVRLSSVVATVQSSHGHRQKEYMLCGADHLRDVSPLAGLAPLTAAFAAQPDRRCPATDGNIHVRRTQVTEFGCHSEVTRDLCRCLHQITVFDPRNLPAGRLVNDLHLEGNPGLCRHILQNASDIILHGAYRAA